MMMNQAMGRLEWDKDNSESLSGNSSNFDVAVMEEQGGIGGQKSAKRIHSLNWAWVKNDLQGSLACQRQVVLRRSSPSSDSIGFFHPQNCVTRICFYTLSVENWENLELLNIAVLYQFYTEMTAVELRLEAKALRREFNQ